MIHVRSLYRAINQPIFRIQYASNLFVDTLHGPFDSLVKPVPGCSTLALLGNIGRPDHNYTRYFLSHCVKHWDRVLWILGPHELTTRGKTERPFFETADDCAQLANEFDGSVTIMNHTELHLPESNVSLIGATLWTTDPQYMPNQPEFTSILQAPGLPLSPDTYRDWNKEDKDFITMKANYWSAVESTTRVIVLTHHLPSPLLMNRGLSNETYARSCLDVNNCAKNISPVIRVWLSGATGSCSSGYLGRHAGQQTFCAVNSCFEYPGNQASSRNPTYLDSMIVDVDTLPPSKPPGPGLPKGQRLPPLISGIFKPIVSSS